MTGRLRRGAGIGLSVLILMGPLSSISAVASNTEPTPPSGTTQVAPSYVLKPEAFSLTVSPTRLIVGQTDISKVQTVQVINQGSASAAITVQKRNFNPGADGSLSYQDDAPFGAAQWVAVDPAAFDLEPGMAQTVTATVTQPADAEPGDHQVALVFLAPAGQTDANIKINRGIGLPMYVTVPGVIDDSASLGDLDAPWFAINGPVPVTTTVTNTGTVHRDFRGPSALPIDAAGDTATFPDFTVPRGSVRDISTTWDPPLMCICNPSVQFTNADGNVQSATAQVIIFPLHLFAIGVGILLVLGLCLLVARRSYRASVRNAAASMNRPAGRGDA